MPVPIRVQAQSALSSVAVRVVAVAVAVFGNQALEISPSAATSTGRAAVLSPQELIQRMEAAQRDLRTLSADFVQTSRVKLFKQEMSSSGRMLCERSPAETRLRWEYLRPDPSTLVLVGGQARLRMGNLPPQVFDTARDPNLRAIFAQLRLWLGAGSFSEAGSEYDLRVGGDPAQKRPALILLPRASSVLGKTFSRVELHLDGQSWQLTRLLLFEQSGDEKEIVFTRVQRNVALPAGSFSL
jgi:outer membrane lipoprotein-sorting protein